MQQQATKISGKASRNFGESEENNRPAAAAVHLTQNC